MYTRDVHVRLVASSRPDRWYGGRTKIRRSIHVTITLTSQVGYPYRCTGAPMPPRFRHAMPRGTHKFSRDIIRKSSCIDTLYLYVPSFTIAFHAIKSKTNFLITIYSKHCVRAVTLPKFPQLGSLNSNCTGARITFLLSYIIYITEVRKWENRMQCPISAVTRK